MSAIYRWVRDNGIITMMWSSFAMLVAGFATFQVFWDVTKIDGSVVGALGVVYGLPAAAITAWQWRLGWVAKKECEDALQ